MAKIALQTAGRIGGSAGSPRPVGRVVGRYEVHVDHRRRLAHAHQRELVEVALHRAAVFDRDLLRHQLGEPVDHRALHLVDARRSG